MGTPFSRLLVEFRKRAGFPTAYRFFHDNGGKAALKISYRNYLLIEQGRCLPGLDRLGVFMFALHVFPKSPEAKSFVSAWLEAMAGPDNFRDFLQPLLAASEAPGGLSPMQAAVGKAVEGMKVNLSAGQMEAVFASPANYLCFQAITSDRGAWNIKEFAARLRLREAEAERALKALARVRIVKQAKKGVYRSPMAGALLQYPRRELLSPELREKMDRYPETLAGEGTRVMLSRTMVRADRKQFHNFFPVMQLNNDAAATYAVLDKSDSSALYLVEGKIVRVREF